MKKQKSICVRYIRSNLFPFTTERLLLDLMTEHQKNNMQEATTTHGMFKLIFNRRIYFYD